MEDLQLLEILAYLEAEGFIRSEMRECEDGEEMLFFPEGSPWVPDEPFLQESDS